MIRSRWVPTLIIYFIIYTHTLAHKHTHNTCAHMYACMHVYEPTFQGLNVDKRRTEGLSDDDVVSLWDARAWRLGSSAANGSRIPGIPPDRPLDAGPIDRTSRAPTAMSGGRVPRRAGGTAIVVAVPRRSRCATVVPRLTQPTSAIAINDDDRVLAVRPSAVHTSRTYTVHVRAARPAASKHVLFKNTLPVFFLLWQFETPTVKWCWTYCTGTSSETWTGFRGYLIVSIYTHLDKIHYNIAFGNFPPIIREFVLSCENVLSVCWDDGTI